MFEVLFKKNTKINKKSILFCQQTCVPKMAQLVAQVLKKV